MVLLVQLYRGIQPRWKCVFTAFLNVFSDLLTHTPNVLFTGKAKW